MIIPPRPPAPSFRLVRYFIVASLAVFVPVAATLLYFDLQKNNFFKRVQKQRDAFFVQMQDSFVQRHDAAAPAYLLRVHEAGNVNLARLFMNTLWDKDFAPFVAKAQRVPVDQCRAIADVEDAGGRAMQPREKEACYAGIGRQIVALPEFRALDAKVFELVKKSTVLKIKVYDLRGITVYSSEHDQIGQDDLGNAGWQSAIDGKPASQLTHRGKFSAFEGEVANRDLISSYVPVMAPGSERIAAVFEVYSDITQFLAQITSTSSEIQALSAAGRAQLERAAAANQDKVNANANLMLVIVLGMFALLYCALYLIVRNGQRIIDKQHVERTRMIGVLHESEDKLRAIFESVIDGILVADVENRKFLIGNPAICRMLGYTLEEIMRLGVQDIHPEQDLPQVMEQFERQLRDESEIAVDSPVKRKDGSVFYADVKTSLISFGGKDGLLGVFRDVTERKRIEEKLRDSVAFRELLLQAMPLPVFHKDASGRYTGCNRAFAKFIGKTENDILGKTVYEVAPQSFAQTYRDRDLELLDDPAGMQDYESHVMHADGTVHDVIFHKARTIDRAGRPTGIIGVITDISERIRTQNELRRLNETLEQRVAERTNALQAANRELEAFSYSVSHDLRAPLRAIDGFSSLIEKSYAEQLDERGRDYFSRVRAGAARMADLIDDLLKLSRISRQEMRRCPVDLSGLAHEVIEELKDEESERKAEWVIAPKVVTQGDRGLLKVMLKNLIGNALKYSSGRDAVRIEFGVADQGGRPVYFVRDNGVGFDMAYADKLFRAFQRLHSPAEFPGTGIGLATVARIIGRHGGRAWAEGQVGKGATFYFTL